MRVVKNNPAISFVILTWNSEATIEECLESVHSRCIDEDLEHQIIVVDNGSTDRTPDILRELASAMPLEVLRLDTNLGTTKPRNMALRRCTGDVIVILDSDTKLLDGSIRKTADYLLTNPTIGILAPKLLFSDGDIQRSVRPFPSMYDKFGKIPAILFRLSCRENDYRDFPFDTVRDVDYAISACWFLRPDVLEAVGYLDERIFYAPEDIDFCLRVWKADLRTVYYPGFTVLHHVQRITHKHAFSKIAFSHLWGLLYYFRKHGYCMSPKKEPDSR